MRLIATILIFAQLFGPVAANADCHEVLLGELKKTLDARLRFYEARAQYRVAPKTSTPPNQAAHAVRDYLVRKSRTYHGRSYTANAYDDGTPVQSLYLARSYFNQLLPGDPDLNAATIEAEIEALLTKVKTYPEDSRLLIDKELSYRLQYERLQSELARLKATRSKGPVRIEIPVIERPNGELVQDRPGDLMRAVDEAPTAPDAVPPPDAPPAPDPMDPLAAPPLGAADDAPPAPVDAPAAVSEFSDPRLSTRTIQFNRPLDDIPLELKKLRRQIQAIEGHSYLDRPLTAVARAGDGKPPMSGTERAVRRATGLDDPTRGGAMWDRGYQQAADIKRLETYRTDLQRYLDLYGKTNPEGAAKARATIAKIDELIGKSGKPVPTQLAPPDATYQALKWDGLISEAKLWFGKDLLPKEFPNDPTKSKSVEFVKKMVEFARGLPEEERRIFLIDVAEKRWTNMKRTGAGGGLAALATAGYLGVYEGTWDESAKKAVEGGLHWAFNASKRKEECAIKPTDKEYGDCVALYLQERYDDEYAVVKRNSLTLAQLAQLSEEDVTKLGNDVKTAWFIVKDIQERRFAYSAGVAQANDEGTLLGAEHTRKDINSVEHMLSIARTETPEDFMAVSVDWLLKKYPASAQPHLSRITKFLTLTLYEDDFKRAMILEEIRNGSAPRAKDKFPPAPELALTLEDLMKERVRFLEDQLRKKEDDALEAERKAIEAAEAAANAGGGGSVPDEGGSLEDYPPDDYGPAPDPLSEDQAGGDEEFPGLEMRYRRPQESRPFGGRR